MTLNDKDIKKILKLSDRTGSCPDKNVFIAVLMNELSEKDQAAFFDHVLRCKECGEEFALMKRVFFETKDTLDDLSRLDLSGGELQRVKDYARQQIRLHKGGRGIRFLSAFRSSFL
ncbi:MAG: hypothetical protein KAX11_06940, partial [Candidatus Aminicenantes bacterium]|nr:hypothetical protein [Candidatus Aminicenantes bacterium]